MLARLFSRVILLSREGLWAKSTQAYVNGEYYNAATQKGGPSSTGLPELSTAIIHTFFGAIITSVGWREYQKHRIRIKSQSWPHVLGQITSYNFLHMAYNRDSPPVFYVNAIRQRMREQREANVSTLTTKDEKRQNGKYETFKISSKDVPKPMKPPPLDSEPPSQIQPIMSTPQTDETQLKEQFFASTVNTDDDPELLRDYATPDKYDDDYGDQRKGSKPSVNTYGNIWNTPPIINTSLDPSLENNKNKNSKEVEKSPKPSTTVPLSPSSSTVHYFTARPQYTYQLSNSDKVYISDAIWADSPYMGFLAWEGEDVQKIAEELFPPQVEVYYNPNNPSQSALIKGTLPEEDKSSFAVFLMMQGVGLYFLYNGPWYLKAARLIWKRGREQRNSN